MLTWAVCWYCAEVGKDLTPAAGLAMLCDVAIVAVICLAAAVAYIGRKG